MKGGDYEFSGHMKCTDLLGLLNIKALGMQFLTMNNITSSKLHIVHIAVYGSYVFNQPSTWKH